MRGRTVRTVLVACCLFLLVGCNEVELFSELSELSAQEVIVVLRTNGISADKIVAASGQEKTWTVVVASADASNAWQVLVENDLPREQPKGFDVFFGKSKLIPTETEEKAIFLQALCGELARTIEAMPSVIDARVHISVPEKDPLRHVMEGREPPQAKAAIMVKHWRPQGNVPPEERIDDMDIKRIVANSVEGLKAQNVEVVLKGVTPKNTEMPARGGDAASIFMPLAIVVGVLLLALLFMLFRNRSLSRQIAEHSASSAEPSGPGADSS